MQRLGGPAGRAVPGLFAVGILVCIELAPVHVPAVGTRGLDE